jgi:hypothetical protein
VSDETPPQDPRELYRQLHPKAEPMAPKQRAPEDQRPTKITVTEQLVWQRSGRQPKSVKTGFELISKGVLTEPITLDPITVGPEPVQVDLSRWARVAQLIVENLEGHFQVIPTPAEREQVMNRIVKLDHDPDGKFYQVVMPLAAQRYSLEPGAPLYLKCPNGPARVTITVLPG